MKLWIILFETAMGFENGLYVLQSKKQPTKEECIKAIGENIHSGAIYFDSVNETTEKDLRYKEYTLMTKTVKQDDTKVTVREARLNHNKIPIELIYIEQPLVVVSDENMVMWSGSKEEFISDILMNIDYYDDCTIKAREYDIHLANNEKIQKETVKEQLVSAGKIKSLSSKVKCFKGCVLDLEKQYVSSFNSVENANIEINVPSDWFRSSKKYNIYIEEVS